MTQIDIFRANLRDLNSGEVLVRIWTPKSAPAPPPSSSQQHLEFSFFERLLTAANMRLTDAHLPPKLAKKIAKLHQEYERSPLQRGDILPWKGSSLYPSFLNLPLPSSEATTHRAPIESLLSASAPCRSRNGERRLQLIEPLRVGKYSERSSQVWRCKVLGRENQTSDGEVVLKLYYKNWNQCRAGYRWKDAESMVEDEAMAYERLKPIQGCQAPICYGFFDFVVTGGFVIKGVVLEDLTLITKTLVDEAARMHPKKLSKHEYSRWFDSILTRLCISLHELHKCNLTLRKSAQARDMLIPMGLVPTISSDTPYDEPLIFVGFGSACLFDTASESPEDVEYLKLDDCQQTFDALGRTRVFPERAIEKWQYYARKYGHYLLDEGIIFDDGDLEDDFVESESDSEEDDEDVSGGDDSDNNSDAESESD